MLLHLHFISSEKNLTFNVWVWSNLKSNWPYISCFGSEMYILWIKNHMPECHMKLLLPSSKQLIRNKLSLQMGVERVEKLLSSALLCRAEYSFLLTNHKRMMWYICIWFVYTYSCSYILQPGAITRNNPHLVGWSFAMRNNNLKTVVWWAICDGDDDDEMTMTDC